MTTSTVKRHFVKPPCFGIVTVSVTVTDVGDTTTRAFFQVFRDVGDGIVVQEESHTSFSEFDMIEMFNEWRNQPWYVVGTKGVKPPNHL